MGCSNCFNGCADIVSDRCVKYTGIDIPGLNIFNGDPLLVVELQITQVLQDVMTGVGVIPVIAPADLCSLVSSFLPSSGTINLNQVLSALFKTVCALDVRLTAAEGTLTTLNADYAIGCLTGVVASSDTHAILQATITKVCSVSADLSTLTAELIANYVLINDINDYIEAYLAGVPASAVYNTRMIPWVAVPYFGVTTGFFDITGAGIGQWDKIYLCNGQNLTPDLRGRVLVGNTTMGNTAYTNPGGDPTIPGNPTYAQGDLVGSNLAVLTSPNQLPLHDHPTTVTINDPLHAHSLTIQGGDDRASSGNHSKSRHDRADNYTTDVAATGLKGTGVGQNVFVTVGAVGSIPSAGHPNIQPVFATNFIIYIP